MSEVEAQGKMWASPGPYLRQSMLVTLARKFSDLYLPETFYEHTIFLEADGCAARPKEEEEDLAMSLVIQLKDERDAVENRIKGLEDSDEERESDED